MDIPHCVRLAGGNNLMQQYLGDAHECGFSFYLRNWMAFKMQHKNSQPLTQYIVLAKLARRRRRFMWNQRRIGGE